MTAGTAEIRAALGNGASKVTTAQIQEALWHYYFDAEKALAFLVSKHVTPTSPKSRKKEPKKGQTEGGSAFLLCSSDAHTGDRMRGSRCQRCGLVAGVYPGCTLDWNIGR